MSAVPWSLLGQAAVPEVTSAGEIVVGLGPLSLARPASFATNLLLAVQCAWMASRISHRRWRGFFAWAALGALVGAFKHGFHHVAPDALQQSVTATSNISLGLAVASAQAAVLPKVSLLPRLQALAIVVVNLSTRSFGVTALVLTAGMLPVIVGSALAHHYLRPRLLTGWGVAASAGLVWAAGWAPAPWFDHTDVAHLALMAGLVGVFLAARRAGAVVPRARLDRTEEASWS